MRKLRLILGFVMLLACSPAVNASMPLWEPAKSSQMQQDPETDDVIVIVQDGFIYLQTTKAVNIKVFSIVGQLITEQNLQPGTWRLKMPKRGIYILRAGPKTIRLTI